MYQLNPLLEGKIGQFFANKAAKMAANPTASATAIGAGIGGVAGGVSGLQKDKNGKRHILRNAAIGAGIGGVAGRFAGKYHAKKVGSLNADLAASNAKNAKLSKKYNDALDREWIYKQFTNPRVKAIEQNGQRYTRNRFGGVDLGNAEAFAHVLGLR